nr:MAG TPA: Portal protein [Caudoviricetes sp.]
MVDISNIDKVSSSRRRSKVDTDTIASALENPYSNVTTLQQQAELMRVINGNLKEIINYKSNLLTYDHYLVPLDASKFMTKGQDNFFKSYRKACLELEKYNLKTLCPWILESEFRKGEIYLYKQETSDSITFVSLPEDLCKVTYTESFMLGYSIKLSGINTKQLGYYPTDIQDLYASYKAGTLKNDENFVDNYYKLPLENAIAFLPEVIESKGIPYYSGLLLDLSRIKDLADASMENIEANNFKLIHQLLPTDDDGDLSIEPETATFYHRALVKNVRDGIGVVSSPYPIDSVSLQTNKVSDYGEINNLTNNVYDTAGIDSNLFNGDNRSSTQSVIYGTIVDSLVPLNLLDRIKIWLNYVFSKNSSLKNFQLYFCDTTKFNKEEKIQSSCNRLTTWTSKLEHLGICGYSPLEALNILQIESILDFGTLMSPLANSHTMSGADIENTGGRPSASEESGDPNRMPESSNAGDY